VEDDKFEVVFDFFHILITKLREHLANAWTFVLEAEVAYQLILLFFKILPQFIKGWSGNIFLNLLGFRLVNGDRLCVMDDGLTNLDWLFLIKRVCLSCFVLELLSLVNGDCKCSFDDEEGEG
jgi:hypothetical protein